MVDNLPVLIAGAGPSGLVAALTLAQNRIQVRIIDKAEKPHVGSRGFGIQPRTCELFQTLGILEDFQKRATPIPTMRAYKLPGGTVPVKTWDLYAKTGVWPDRPFGNGVCLSQDQLEDILIQHLKQHGIVIEYGKGLINIEQTEDNVISTVATFRNGQQMEEQEKVTSQFLLGTDGARGVSRKLLGLTFQGETRDTDGMVWGDVEIDGLTSDYWHIWGKPGVYTIMARPITPDGKKFGIGITGQNFDPRDLADEEKAKEFILKETGRTDIKFGKFTWLSYFKPNMRMINKFQVGRAFVVGDAGHVHSPTGGQGLNCSVQDATNLSWKLALVLKGLAPQSLLSTYNDERLPVIAQMLQATSQLYTHTIIASKEKPVDGPSEDDDKKSGWFRWRNTALELYGINYRFSDIVLEERDPERGGVDREEAIARAYAGYEALGTLIAGDRAPEAPGLVTVGGKETSLFKDYFKLDHHTVMAFSLDVKSAGPLLEQASQWPASVVQTLVITDKDSDMGALASDKAIFLVDREQHARNAYRVAKEELTVVIRSSSPTPPTIRGSSTPSPPESAARKHQAEYVKDLEGQLAAGKKRVAALAEKTKKERKEHEDLRDSTARRLAAKLTGRREKWEEKESKEEREYEGKNVVIDLTEKETLYESAKAEPQVLHSRIFDGPTQGIPEDDRLGYDLDAAFKRCDELQARLNAESRAAELLARAARCMQSCSDNVQEA
ncbi:unnamed protein product [Cyclocybe aegerita]|uniref:FAD-binding domain-containing protein n=1 Tax=Cyclocybe aegerita TaxID=1973307 RepID=A0A8S0W984_CYCAE|nr:unnamed protein product [Cyclocybe aegerita]